MDWKEFFKPNKSQIIIGIVIFIVLSVISYFLLLIYYSQFLLYCMAIGCPTAGSKTVNMFVKLIIPLLLVSYIISAIIKYLKK